MAIVIVCGAVLALGLAASVRWSRLSFAAPDPLEPLPPLEVARRCIWYVSITLTAGVAAGICTIGAGGRLAMRLLAATAGDAAQGRLTEADQLVGEITLGGTIGFVAFTGIFSGAVFGALFLIVRRFLPPGPAGGVAYGLGLLIVFGAILDPLRKDNPDFDIVGPGWLAVVVFTMLAVGFGVVLRGFTARMSIWLPLPRAERKVLARYVVPGLLAAVFFTVTAATIVVGLIVVLATRWRVPIQVIRSSRWIIAGRVVLAVVVVVSSPALLTSVIGIASR